MSENVVPAKVDEQFVSKQVSSIEIVVSREVILGYVSPSRSKVPTPATMRNPDGNKVPITLD